MTIIYAQLREFDLGDFYWSSAYSQVKDPEVTVGTYLQVAQMLTNACREGLCVVKILPRINKVIETISFPIISGT